MRIYKILDTDELCRKTFHQSPYPPIPEEVLTWDIDLQELFCSLSLAHQWMGAEEADRLAIEQVKESESYARWVNKQTGD